MDLEELLELCDEYVRLGTAVQGQLKDVLEGQSASEQNYSALKLMRPLLEKAQRMGVDDLGVLSEINAFIAEVEEVTRHEAQ